MAISYVSSVVQSNPYVLPVDLNLLGRVNQYKQSMFYKNAAALKQQFANIKNSDIINAEQKKRLETQYNNVMNQIREAGPIDYSDMNIAGQVEKLGSSIYDDPYILQGIASTKKIRKLEAIYEKFKTDPKLSKYYSHALEAYDKRFINDYVNGGLDASYQGPDTPTKYLGNTMDLLTKNGAIAKLPAQVRAELDSNGNVYMLFEKMHKYMDSEQINAFVQANLTPDVMNQMRAEAWYNYRGYSNEALEQIYSERYNKDINVISSHIDKLKEDLLTADTEEKKKIIQSSIDSYGEQLTSLSDALPSKLSEIRTALSSDSGRETLIYNLYATDMVNNIIKSYKYDDIRLKAVQNYENIYKTKYELEQERIRQQKLSQNKDKTPESFVSDAYVTEPNTQTEDDVKDIEVNAENIDSKISEIADESSELIKNFFLNNKGSEYTKYLEELAKVDGQPGISIADLRNYEKSVERLVNNSNTGFINTLGNNKIMKNVVDANIKERQLAAKYFKNVANTLDAIANGKPVSSDLGFNINEATLLYDQIRANNIRQQSLIRRKNEFLDYALSGIPGINKLNSREKDILYKNLTAEKSTVYAYSSPTVMALANNIGESSSSTENSEYIKVLSKLKIPSFKLQDYEPDIKTKSSEFWEKPINNEKIGQTTSTFLNPKIIKEKHFDLAAFAKEQGYLKDSPETKTSEYSVDKIQIIKVRMLDYNERKKNPGVVAEIHFDILTDSSTGTVAKGIAKVNQQQLKSFGLTAKTDYEASLDYALEVDRALPPAYVNVDNWSKNKQSPTVKYRITKPGSDVILEIYNGNKVITLKSLPLIGPFTSGSQAEEAFKTLLKTQAGSIKREDFFKLLEDYQINGK